MIKIVFSEPSYKTQLTKLAFARSTPSNLVEDFYYGDQVDENSILVCCGLSDDEIDTVYKNTNGLKTKLIILGRLSPFLLSQHNLAEVQNIDFKKLTDCHPAEPFKISKSSGQIVYNQQQILPNFCRPLCRFDYADEWNNLGFGRIPEDGIFALSQQILETNNYDIASLLDGDTTIGSYSILVDEDDRSILWIGRSLGSIDGPDWIITEEFISNYRAEDLPCAPIISEIPFGYDGAVTMRLDCDEDIQSAEPLIDLYHSNGVPISLAITTQLLSDSRHQQTIELLFESGGGILSHSHTHAPFWGGSYNTAFKEAVQSRELLFSILQKNINHAVAPFHHAPTYALSALSDAGYTACVGGVMNVNPEFILGRSGFISNSHSLIGMTQQCMLHGHTISTNSNLAETYISSFDLSLKSNRFHGYLDHPFSERYQYDWISEQQRLSVHDALIKHMKSHNNILYLNENDALDFLISRSHAKFDRGDNSIKYDVRHPHKLDLCWQFKGNVYKSD